MSRSRNVSCVTLPATLSSLLEKAKSAAGPVAATVVRKLTACDVVETKLEYHRKLFYYVWKSTFVPCNRNSASLAANKPCASREVSQLAKHCSGQKLAAEDASTLRTRVLRRNRVLKQKCMSKQNCLPDRLRALKIQGELDSLYRSAQMRYCVLGRSNNVGSLRLITADKQEGYRSVYCGKARKQRLLSFICIISCKVLLCVEVNVISGRLVTSPTRFESKSKSKSSRFKSKSKSKSLRFKSKSKSKSSRFKYKSKSKSLMSGSNQVQFQVLAIQVQVQVQISNVLKLRK
jgi:hypothetical protein